MPIPPPRWIGSVIEGFDNPCRIPCHDGVGRDTLRDYTARCHDTPFTDTHSLGYESVHSYPHARGDDYRRGHDFWPGACSQACHNRVVFLAQGRISGVGIIVEDLRSMGKERHFSYLYALRTTHDAAVPNVNVVGDDKTGSPEIFTVKQTSADDFVPYGNSISRPGIVAPCMSSHPQVLSKPRAGPEGVCHLSVFPAGKERQDPSSKPSQEFLGNKAPGPRRHFVCRALAKSVKSIDGHVNPG